MRRKAIASAAVMATVALVAGCSHEYVPIEPAQAVTDAYYGALKANDVVRAKQQFSASFKRETDSWPRLIHLSQLQEGPVVSSEIQAASLVAHDDQPCYALTYHVKRQRPGSETEELMVVCRSAGPDRRWFIDGHSITRAGNGDNIRAGLIPEGIKLKL